MKPPATKLIAMTAGLGALAVVLILAASWRKIYHSCKPEAQLWGRWQLHESSNPDIKESNKKHFIHFYADGKVRFSDSVDLKYINSIPTRYRIEGNRVINFFNLSKTHWPRRYYFENPDSLVIFNDGHQDKYRRLPIEEQP